MAGSKEVALGVASVVEKKGLPNPLVITFRSSPNPRFLIRMSEFTIHQVLSALGSP
jgi:hypothetical protein